MKEYARYAIGVLTVVIIVVLFVVGFNVLKNLFKGDDGKKETKTSQDKPVSLFDEEASNKPVQYTVHGAINGNDDHRSIRVTVSPEKRRVEILKGYNNEVIKSQEADNTQEAYDAFIKAISGAGFTTTVTGERGDEGQSCQLGRRYNYEIAPGESDSSYTWSTSCTRKQGTFGGNATLVRQLFQKQVPNYDDFVRGTVLG